MKQLVLLTLLSISVLASAQDLLKTINSSADEYGMTFIEENLVLFTRNREIYFTQLANGQWSDPKVVSFGSKHGDEYPSYDPANQRLIFSSKRLRPNSSAPLPANDLWSVKYRNGEWRVPKHLGGETSSEGIDSGGFSVAGSIYFHSNRGGSGLNDVDIYELNGTEVVKLSISTDKVDGEVFLFGDGNAMLFMSAGHGAIGNSDIFISTKAEGVWQQPIPIDTTGLVNTENWDYDPLLSLDQKVLYFTRYTSGQSDIQMIDVSKLSSYPTLLKYLD